MRIKKSEFSNIQVVAYAATNKTNLKGAKHMATKFMITAAEIKEELGVSQAYAYKLIRKLNEELEAKGYTVVAGKVSRKYFEEQFYGMAEAEQKGA